MIYLKTFLAITFLTVICLFSWMCNQEDPVMNNSVTIQTDDGGCARDVEFLTFLVKEYVKVTQFDNNRSSIYYEYRTVMDITCCDCFESGCDGSSCFHYSYFTTPYASRLENGALVETQHYRIIGTSEWNTIRGNTLVWDLKNGTTNYYKNDQHPFDNIYSYSFDTTVSISGNVAITATYGKDEFSD